LEGFLVPDRIGADHWRERAEEARALAEHLRDGDASGSMSKIAEEYEKMASRAEWREWQEAERKSAARVAGVRT